jgi:hypothetical protein
MTMLKQFTFGFSIRIAGAGLAVGLLSTPAQALTISLDLTTSDSADSYGPGPGVFGSSTSFWNYQPRTDSATDLPLFDDTQAATGVTVSYSRTDSNGSAANGAFQNLGRSVTSTGVVAIKGLIAGSSYDLAIYSSFNGTPTFSVNGISKNTTATSDWSSLVEGTNYVLFSTQADSSGQISFVPEINAGFTADSSSRWSAFQIHQSTPAPVPAPVPLFGAAAAFSAARRLRGLSSRLQQSKL